MYQPKNARRAARPASQWIEALEPRAMLSAAVINWHGHDETYTAGQWIVKIDGVHGNAGQQVAAANAKVQAAGAKASVTQQLGADGLFLVTTAEGDSYANVHAALGRVNGFKFVEPDFTLWSDAVTNDPSFGTLWGLNNTGQSGGTPDADIDGPEAWNLGTGSGVVVGVIDSGVDYTHPDLANNIWTNPGEIAGDGIDNDGNGFVDDLHGWDFANNDSDPMDDNNHGTHVAGTIAATGNNGVGVVGVAYSAQIMALKFLGANGSGSTSAAVSAINYATKMRTSYGINIRVTNNSWSGGGYSTALYNAIKASGDAGMLFMAAASNGGNDGVGDNNDVTPQYPSSYDLPNIIAIAATDRNDNLASFSNYGVTSVDLAAPGVSILSTTPNNTYSTYSGTSMATPHVSGVAALAFAYSPSASFQTVRDAILRGADAKSSLTGKVATGGRLNAYNTLQLLANPVTTAPLAASGLTATAASSSAINLAWTDNATDEAGYYVFRAADGVNFSKIATLGAGTTTFSDTGLAASTTYSYLVRAYNSAGESPDSNTASATTNAPLAIPAGPTNLGALAISQTQIALTWTDNASNETGFYVESSTNGKAWTRIATLGANSTAYTAGGLRKKTAYYFRVVAYNAAGLSAYSNVATTVTKAAGEVVVEPKKRGLADFFADSYTLTPV